MTPDRLSETLQRELAAVGVSPAPHDLEDLIRYLELIVRWRTRARLTAISDPLASARTHVADSLLCLRAGLAPGSSLIDVGSGAGLPGIPVAIVRRDLQVTLLEPDGRKAAFLELAVTQLGLRVSVAAMTAEAAGRGALRESFDLAAARAVAPLVPLCELTLPLVRVGGRVVLLKGPSVRAELGDGRKAAALLGGGELELSEWALAGGEQRMLVVARKERSTPDRFPRRPGIPRIRPIKG